MNNIQSNKYRRYHSIVLTLNMQKEQEGSD